MTTDEASMALIDHLRELRSRLIKSFLALAITTVVSFAIVEPLLKILIKPVRNIDIILLGPTEGIIIWFKVALVSGVAFALPVILYQLLSFIVPGLLPNERKYLYFILPSATLSFFLGILFTYFIILNAAIPFLESFLADIFKPTWTLERYMSLVTTLMLWIGLAFETPLIMAFLSFLGIVSPQRLSAFRRYAIVVAALLAAMITPTVDPFNMALVMIPLVLLFEIGLLLSRVTYRGPRESLTSASNSDNATE